MADWTEAAAAALGLPAGAVSAGGVLLWWWKSQMARVTDLEQRVRALESEPDAPDHSAELAALRQELDKLHDRAQGAAQEAKATDPDRAVELGRLDERVQRLRRDVDDIDARHRDTERTLHVNLSEYKALNDAIRLLREDIRRLSP